MTDFATHGFLSDDIRDFEADILANFKDRFDLANEANKVAHEIIYSVDIHRNLTDRLLATLLTRQASSFQSFLILIRKGLLAQGEIILRNISETMFIVGAIGKDETFAERYVLSEEVSRRKALVRLRENHKKHGKETEQETIELFDEKEVRERKLQVFKTLMATRAYTISPNHVEALNKIDLEFSPKKKHEKQVLDAWKEYLDVLGNRELSPEQWSVRRVDLLVELLFHMGRALDYDFDKTQIRNGTYSPVAHGKIEEQQEAILQGLIDILEGKRYVPTFVANLHEPPPVKA